VPGGRGQVSESSSRQTSRRPETSAAVGQEPVHEESPGQGLAAAVLKDPSAGGLAASSAGHTGIMHASAVQHLQRAAGNQAVQRLLAGGPASPGVAVQRAGPEEEEPLQMKRAPGYSSVAVQRAGPEEEQPLQMKRAPGYSSLAVQREPELSPDALKKLAQVKKEQAE